MNKELKTMIVDDDEVSAGLLEIMLNRLGIREIEKAGSGRQAIDLYKTGLKNNSPYALVFLDIIMPGIDGQETLKYLRAVEKEEGIASACKAVIIMTTSLSTTKAMIEAIFEGDCTDYLVKPIGPAYLGKMLAKRGLIAKAL
jgi:two-component system chemotaxis response regulator CheY